MGMESGMMRSVILHITLGAGPYACDEFMWLIEGQPEIRNIRTGAAFVFGPGDAFFVPEGLVCSGKVEDEVTLFFSILKSF